MIGDEESDPNGLIEEIGFAQPGRTTCDRNKLYLDLAATNNSVFMVENLSNVHRIKPHSDKIATQGLR